MCSRSVEPYTDLSAKHSRDLHGTLGVTTSASAARGETGSGEHRDERVKGREWRSEE